ncbi:MAG: 3-dehydroquinate synthase [Micropruina sp.]
MSWSTVDVMAEQPYQVVIGHGASSLLPQFLQEVQRVAVIYPESQRLLAAGLVKTIDQPVTMIEVPTAERAKTGLVLQHCWDALAAAGFTRTDTIVGFGGGATTDLAGFVAATWLRGVPYICVPTSVLAMVDAAVGGKTGINLASGKNLVGAFYEPFTVLCDLDFLEGLPPAELSSGLAEVVKAGFIADPFILSVIEDNPLAARTPGSPELAELIRRAVAVKASVVSADLRERTSTGSDVGRELLNYGHTLGHAIERHENYTMRHGEAVSIGMTFIAELSRRLGRLDDDTAGRHAAVLSSVGLPTCYRAAAWPLLREAMNLDKKTRGSALRFVILDGLAHPAILTAPDEELMEQTFASICLQG